MYWYKFEQAENRNILKFKNLNEFTWEKLSWYSDSAAVNSTKALLRVFVNNKFVGFRIISSISVLLQDMIFVYW
jgi:hypothetical protein